MELPIYEFIIDEKGNHFTTSIVKDAAVEKTLMYFNSESEKPVFFANEEKRIVYSVAMEPMKYIFRKETDSFPAHYGFFTEESIQKFQENYSKFKGNEKVNIDHTEKPIEGVFMIENWIVDNPEIDKTKSLGIEAKKGSLIQGFKIENDEVWEKCKNGDLDGLSIEAHLDRKLINKNEVKMTKEEKTPQSFWEMCKTFFSADDPEVDETEEEKAKRLEEEAKAKEEMAAAPEPAPAEEPKPADETEILKAENEDLKAQVEELKTKLADMEAEKVKAETDLETMKKQTPKSDAIPITPKVEMKKEFKDMTPLEQYRFKKELNK